jgi:membrane-associated phospholipid phosphatase
MQAGTPAQGVTWYGAFATHLMHLWFIKATGTAAFMASFFYGYFAVQLSPMAPVFIMPTSWFDDAIAFWPPAFYLYASLWLYTSLVPALQPSFIRLLAYGFTIGSLCLSGLLIFLFFPTAVPYAMSDWFVDPSLSLLRSLDLAGNACPSLHVATAVLSGMCLHHLLRRLNCPLWCQVVNWLWCVLIIYSTLAIKQHVMWDVIAGGLLGVLFGWLYSQVEDRLDAREAGLSRAPRRTGRLG